MQQVRHSFELQNNFSRDIISAATSLLHLQRSLWLRLTYTQDRLRIGWGSFRVGLGKHWLQPNTRHCVGLISV
jgi:hypothetical protein